MKKSVRKHLKPQSRRLALEQRIVFDAALPVAGQDVWDVDAGVWRAGLAHEAQPQANADTGPLFTQQADDVIAAVGELPDFGVDSPRATEIVFVDARVADVLPFIKSTDSVFNVLFSDKVNDFKGFFYFLNRFVP